MAVRTRFTALVAMAAVAATVAACSSSKSPSSTGTATGSSTGTSLSGTPIRVGWIGTTSSPIYDESPAAVAIAEAVKYINGNGGANGQQLVFDQCNDGFTSNGAASCAQQMVSDKIDVLLSTGSFPTSVLPITEKAGIPNVGTYAESSLATHDPLAFPMFASEDTDDFSAQAVALKNAGATKIVDLVLPCGLCDVNANAATAAARKIGLDVLKTISVPATTTDYSSIVLAIKSSGANGVELIITPTQSTPLLQTAKQLGLHAVFAEPNNFSQTDITQMTSIVSPGEFYLMMQTPPSSATSQYPQMQTYDTALNNSGNAKASTSSGSSIVSWFSVIGLVDALNQAKQTVTSSATLITAIKAAGTVKVGGFDSWTPGGQGPSYEPQFTSSTMFIAEVNNGQVVSATPGSVDMTTVLGS